MAASPGTDGWRVGRVQEYPMFRAAFSIRSTVLRELDGCLVADAVAGARERTAVEVRVPKGQGWEPGSQGAVAVEQDSAGQMSLTELQLKSKTDSIDPWEPAASVDLLKEGTAAFYSLRDAMYLTCARHSADFLHVKEQHDLKYGEWFREFVVFVFAGPLYNLPQCHDDDNLKHYHFSACFPASLELT